MEEETTNPIIIPFGEDCLISIALKELGLRKISLPFDWIGYEGKSGTYFSEAIDLLCNSCNDFFNLDDLENKGPTGNTDKCWYVYNKRTGFRFKHDFPETNSLEEVFQRVKDKYNRRIKRLLGMLNSQKCLIFVHMTYVKINDNLLIQKYNQLKEKFSNAKIDFIILESDNQINKENYQESLITENIKKVTFNNSREVSTNSNDWFRNEEIYKKILKLYFRKVEVSSTVPPFIKITNDNYDIQGKDNKIILIKKDGTERELGENERIEGLNILIKGDNNEITIKKPCRLSNLGIRIRANSSKIVIGENVEIDKLWCEVCGGNNQFISIGDNCKILGLTIQACEENAGFVLGNNSLVSFNVTVWCSDAHSLFSSDGMVLNRISQYMEIGEHCWIGYGATLYKNAKLGKNSVVGGSSVITKAFDEENIVVGGNPARIIKKNINWDISIPYRLEKIKKGKENE